jgi:hypothetical protein
VKSIAGLHKAAGGIRKSLRDCAGEPCAICGVPSTWGVQGWTGIFKPACREHAESARRLGYHVEEVSNQESERQ